MMQAELLSSTASKQLLTAAVLPSQLPSDAGQASPTSLVRGEDRGEETHGSTGPWRQPEG